MDLEDVFIQMAKDCNERSVRCRPIYDYLRISIYQGTDTIDIDTFLYIIAITTRTTTKKIFNDLGVTNIKYVLIDGKMYNRTYIEYIIYLSGPNIHTISLHRKEYYNLDNKDNILSDVCKCFSLYYIIKLRFKSLDKSFIELSDRVSEKYGSIHNFINQFAEKQKLQKEIVYINNTTTDKMPIDNVVKVKNKSKPKTYIMLDEYTGYVKIGYSINVEFREKTLSAQFPKIKTIKIFNKNIENVLHKKYHQYRLRGEWFDIPDYHLNNLLNQIIK